MTMDDLISMKIENPFFVRGKKHGLGSYGAFSRRAVTQGSVAEWSKALVLGTSPKGRGFESHRYHFVFLRERSLHVFTFLFSCIKYWIIVTKSLMNLDLTSAWDIIFHLSNQGSSKIQGLVLTIMKFRTFWIILNSYSIWKFLPT